MERGFDVLSWRRSRWPDGHVWGVTGVRGVVRHLIVTWRRRGDDGEDRRAIAIWVLQAALTGR
jgi:hypothetical protein